MFDPTEIDHRFARWGAFAALLVGFGMTMVALINSMPGVWYLPRIGPFPAEYLRASILVASISVVLLSLGFYRLALERRPGLFVLALVADIFLLVTAVVVSWVFAVVNLEIQESLFFFEPVHASVTMAGVILLIVLCWRVWGLPLALFGALMLLYYFFGQYLPWIFKIIPMSFVDNFSEDLWFNLNKGVLGQIFEIVIFTVFPFIIFGALLEATGVGESLIRAAFSATRRTRGGPAHAAVLASSLFGTMSGVPVANVVGTGVLTIPLIKRRGFSPTFAGGVEATASTGGQIVPPIMGSAALVMADQLQMSYLVIITAALIPAGLYYLSLFFTVTFEARRMEISVDESEIDELRITLGDIINLVILAGAIAVIISTLLYGLSASAAGVFAVFYMVPACFLSPTMRQQPTRVLLGLAKGGTQFARLAIAIGVVGIVLAALSSTGLPIRIAGAIDMVMGQSLLLALMVTGVAAIIFGMGMPTLPAYLTIILIIGPSLTKLGMDLLVAHMFVFYFGVSSAITPPVAIAAYAAASIAGAGALRTAAAALRIGAAIFLVPFIFAYYPELLLVEEAGGTDVVALLSIGVRLLVAIWLLTSSFSRYDGTALNWIEIVVRVALTVAVLIVDPVIHWPAFVIGVAVIAYNNFVAKRRVAAA